jgi:hypothetical protein
MNKIRNGIINSLRCFCLLGVFALGLLAIIGTGGGGGGGGGDPCAGPLPCLATDWGGTFYEFRESDGSPIVVMSDGVVFSGGGVDDNGDVIALAGTVSDCYNGIIEFGAIDYFPPDGNIDYTFTSVSGNVHYCNPTLTISSLIIEGAPQPDIVATYVGVATLFVSNEDQTGREIPPEILFDVMDKMYSEQ